MPIVAVASLVLIALLSVAIVLRGRSLVLVSGTSVALFGALAVLVLSALFVPRPYRAVSRSALDEVGVKDRVADLDRALPVDKLSGMVEHPEDIVRDIVRDRFGIDLGGDDVASALPDTPVDDGYFERAIYDPLVSLIALALRAGTVALGLVAMTGLLGVSYAANALARARDLVTTVGELQARVAALEAGRQL